MYIRSIQIQGSVNKRQAARARSSIVDEVTVDDVCVKAFKVYGAAQHIRMITGKNTRVYVNYQRNIANKAVRTYCAASVTGLIASEQGVPEVQVTVTTQSATVADGGVPKEAAVIDIKNAAGTGTDCASSVRDKVVAEQAFVGGGKGIGLTVKPAAEVAPEGALPESDRIEGAGIHSAASGVRVVKQRYQDIGVGHTGAIVDELAIRNIGVDAGAVIGRPARNKAGRHKGRQTRAFDAVKGLWRRVVGDTV
jgi:hypothetical protein